jgi:hypothetical protein
MARSGTTWIGKMLSAGGRVTYLTEPLNVLRPGIFRLPVRDEYTYVHSGNEADFLPIFQEAARLRPHMLGELLAVRAPTDVGRVGVRVVQFLRGRIGGRRVLFKDPYAVFSADWFADRLGCQVVVVVRHPAAVVSSLRRLGWRAPLASLSAQPALVRDRLEPFRDDLAAAQENASLRRDLIWSNAVLWRMIYSAVATYAEQRPDFLIVRHEDLSRDPENAYRRVYEALEMQYDRRAAAAVKATTDGTNPAELPKNDPHSVRLDSRANLDNWRRRLSSLEIGRIRALTEPVVSRWYAD